MMNEFISSGSPSRLRCIHPTLSAFVVFIGGFFASLFFVLPEIALAEESISSFVSHIELKENGSAAVQEEIVYDLGAKQGHGILRKIPLIYNFPGTSELMHTEISSIRVTNGYGESVDTQYDEGGNMITLRIGNPDVLVSGPQLYVIRYTLWGGIVARLASDEFIWNVTGNDWNVPVERIRADVVLPRVIAPERVAMRCTAGEGPQVEACSSTSTVANVSGSGQTFRFEQNGLSKHAALTILVKIPKGEFLFTTPDLADRVAPHQRIAINTWWRDPFIDLSLSFPFFVFAALYSIWLHEKGKKKGKYADKNARRIGGNMPLSIAYFFLGVATIILSLYIPFYNLGCFLSGIVILVFGFLNQK